MTTTKESVIFMLGRKKHLCLSCKTGKESYELDSRSEVCPYLSCYNSKKKICRFYKPLETDKKPFISKILGAFGKKRAV